MAAGQKRPADFDFARPGTLEIIARCADDGAAARIKRHQRTTARQRFIEKSTEHRFPPAIMRRMPGPDLGVGRGSEKLWPVHNG